MTAAKTPPCNKFEGPHRRYMRNGKEFCRKVNSPNTTNITTNTKQPNVKNTRLVSQNYVDVSKFSDVIKPTNHVEQKIVDHTADFVAIREQLKQSEVLRQADHAMLIDLSKKLADLQLNEVVTNVQDNNIDAIRTDINRLHNETKESIEKHHKLLQTMLMNVMKEFNEKQGQIHPFSQKQIDGIKENLEDLIKDVKNRPDSENLVDKLENLARQQTKFQGKIDEQLVNFLQTVNQNIETQMESATEKQAAKIVAQTQSQIDAIKEVVYERNEVPLEVSRQISELQKNTFTLKQQLSSQNSHIELLDQALESGYGKLEKLVNVTSQKIQTLQQQREMKLLSEQETQTQLQRYSEQIESLRTDLKVTQNAQTDQFLELQSSYDSVQPLLKGNLDNNNQQQAYITRRLQQLEDKLLQIQEEGVKRLDSYAEKNSTNDLRQQITQHQRQFEETRRLKDDNLRVIEAFKKELSEFKQSDKMKSVDREQIEQLKSLGSQMQQNFETRLQQNEGLLESIKSQVDRLDTRQIKQLETIESQNAKLDKEMKQIKTVIQSRATNPTKLIENNQLVVKNAQYLATKINSSEQAAQKLAFAANQQPVQARLELKSNEPLEQNCEQSKTNLQIAIDKVSENSKSSKMLTRQKSLEKLNLPKSNLRPIEPVQPVAQIEPEQDDEKSMQPIQAQQARVQTRSMNSTQPTQSQSTQPTQSRRALGWAASTASTLFSAAKGAAKGTVIAAKAVGTVGTGLVDYMMPEQQDLQDVQEDSAEVNYTNNEDEDEEVEYSQQRNVVPKLTPTQRQNRSDKRQATSELKPPPPAKRSRTNNNQSLTAINEAQIDEMSRSNSQRDEAQIEQSSNQILSDEAQNRNDAPVSRLRRGQITDQQQSEAQKLASVAKAQKSKKTGRSEISDENMVTGKRDRTKK